MWRCLTYALVGCTVLVHAISVSFLGGALWQSLHIIIVIAVGTIDFLLVLVVLIAEKITI